MSSLRDIRLTYTEQKHRSDRSNLWLYLVIRRVSFYVTWACLRLGVSANQATFISIALGGLGCVFLTTGGQRNCVIGALHEQVWQISGFTHWFYDDCFASNKCWCWGI